MKAALVVLASLFLLLTGSILAPALALDAAGKLFIKDAASVDLMEVQMGQVARDRGHSQEVKDYGDRMVRDHTKAGEELKIIAAQKNLRLPATVELKHTLMMASMSKLSGRAFDVKYLQTMVRNHTKSTALFKKAIRKVKDHDLRDWAAATLPILQDHLQLAKALTRKLAQ